MPCSFQVPGFETINSNIVLSSQFIKDLLPGHRSTILHILFSGTLIRKPPSIYLILAALVTPGRCPLQRRVPLQVSQPMPIIVGIVVIRVQQAHLYCFLSPLDLALFSPTCGMLNPGSIIDNYYLTVVSKGLLLASNIAFDTTREIASYATRRQASL